MYRGDQPWVPIFTDPGHDDYFRTDNNNIIDLSRSVFVEPLPPNAQPLAAGELELGDSYWRDDRQRVGGPCPTALSGRTTRRRPATNENNHSWYVSRSHDEITGSDPVAILEPRPKPD
jgi:hypothetical protein